MHQQRCVPTFWPSPKGKLPRDEADMDRSSHGSCSENTSPPLEKHPRWVPPVFARHSRMRWIKISHNFRGGKIRVSFFSGEKGENPPPLMPINAFFKAKWLLHKSEVLHDVFAAQGALGFVVIRGWVPPPLASTGLPDFPTSQPFPLNAEKPKEGEQESHGDRQFLQSRC